MFVLLGIVCIYLFIVCSYLVMLLDAICLVFDVLYRLFNYFDYLYRFSLAPIPSFLILRNSISPHSIDCPNELSNSSNFSKLPTFPLSLNPQIIIIILLLTRLTNLTNNLALTSISSLQLLTPLISYTNNDHIPSLILLLPLYNDDKSVLDDVHLNVYDYAIVVKYLLIVVHVVNVLKIDCLDDDVNVNYVLVLANLASLVSMINRINHIP